MSLEIERIDHLVLTVADVGRTCEFYTRLLGMREETFGEGRRALVFGRQKINLHQYGEEFEPKAASPTPGSADLCLVTALSPDEVLERLGSLGVEAEEGPVERTGALGTMTSVYLRDPDGNLIELSSYPGGG